MTTVDPKTGEIHATISCDTCGELIIGANNNGMQCKNRCADKWVKENPFKYAIARWFLHPSHKKRNK